MAGKAATVGCAIGVACAAQAFAQPVPKSQPSADIPIVSFGHYAKQAWLKGVEGEATVRCKVGLEYMAHVIKSCEVISESPAGLGFGTALIDWAKGQQPARDPQRGYARSVEISYQFRMPKPGGANSMETPKGLAHEWWYPVAALAQQRSGTASVNCLIDEAGGFQDCKVVSESPRNFGFGETSLQMIRQFRAYPLNPADVGQRKTIPLQFKLEL